MEGWLSFSTEAILTGILVVLLLINSNIVLLIRKITNEDVRPRSEQLQKLIEEIRNVKWHVDQIRQHSKRTSPEKGQGYENTVRDE